MNQRILRQKPVRGRVPEQDTAADAERLDREYRARLRARRESQRAERLLALIAECEE